MSVPFIDFSQQYQTIKDEVQQGMTKVFEKGDFILGQAARDFEEEFAQYCGVNYGVGVNSGTDALYLALSSLDVTVGDEVILPSMTFIATALCVSYTGATPVFVDSENQTTNMDPASIEKAITSKTKAIIVVHLYGQPAHMKEILNIAKKHNLKVIEDACQAHGAQYDGQRVGSLGDIGCFSFYPTKGMGAFGDAGMVIAKGEETQNAVRMLRDYGRSDRYNHKIKGYNSRLDTIQAVVLSAKLKHLDTWNQMRQDNAKFYFEQLQGVEGIELPEIQENRTHVFQTFAIRVKDGKRDQVLEKMKDNGVSVLIHYPIPLHLQEAYKDVGHKVGDFPVSESWANELLSLPMFPHMTQEQISTVSDTLKNVLNEVRENANV